MLARKIFNQCIQRLDFLPETQGEELYKSTLQKAVHIINDIYLDLFNITGQTDFVPIESLDDKINLSSKCFPALVYGVCMSLALSLKDTDQYNFYSALYNSQRLKFSSIYKREEVV